MKEEGAVVPDGASGGDVGYGDLANSLLQSRGRLRGGPSRGRVLFYSTLFYLLELVVEAPWRCGIWRPGYSG